MKINKKPFMIGFRIPTGHFCRQWSKWKKYPTEKRRNEAYHQLKNGHSKFIDWIRIDL